jgi:hypothetical protein
MMAHATTVFAFSSPRQSCYSRKEWDHSNERRLRCLEATYVGEQFVHRLLFVAYRRKESKRATEFEGEGWSFTSLFAMVFAFLTVEAYLNYVGERLAPEIWERERTFFRKGGFNGKLLKVRQLVDAPDEPHFQALAEVKELRDRIAHGKPQKLSGGELHALARRLLRPCQLSIRWLPRNQKCRVH